MESTSVYWIPLYELLESRGIEVVLVNARQLHNVPGRKTDFSDCQWLQLLHSCGLLRGSFRPGEAIARAASPPAPAGQSRRRAHALCPVDAEGAGPDERAGASRRHRPHRARPAWRSSAPSSRASAIPPVWPLHRDRRCRKSADEIARYLTGTWRDEHLFNLASALRLFDALGHRDRLV